MLSKGTKITRFVRKCCEEFQMDSRTIVDVTKFEDEHDADDRTFDSFEKLYAKFADSLSAFKTKQITIASLNFLDFMTMSNGNSWTTCQFINSHGIFHESAGYHGQYKQGCLSYALDEPSFIFYTLPVDYKGKDYYICQKLTRMCCQYENGVLITGKCYPKNEDSLIEKYRQTMQMIVSDIENTANKWSFSKDVDRIGTFVTTDRCASHYKDYNCSSQKPTISLCTKLTVDIDKPMKIGHQAYCVYCGKSLERRSTGWLQCDSHRRRMVCKHCGKRIGAGVEHHLIGDHLYCSDCCFYCKAHERYELAETEHTVVVMSCGEVTVCNDSLELLAQCRDCGVYNFKSKMLKTENGYACKKHVRRYVKCDWCGLYVPRKEAHKKENGNSYCATCDEHIGSLDVAVIKKDKYEVGDYVIFKKELTGNRYKYSYEMNRLYPGRISMVTHIDCNINGDYYNIKKVPSDSNWNTWKWQDCDIAGVVVGVGSDKIIGKTLEEVQAMLKGE